MGINNPTKESTYAFEASEHITAPLIALILAQEINQVQRNDPQKVKHLVKRRKHELPKECAEEIKAQLNSQLQRSFKCSPGERVLGLALCSANCRARFPAAQGRVPRCIMPTLRMDPVQHTEIMQLW